MSRLPSRLIARVERATATTVAAGALLFSPSAARAADSAGVSPANPNRAWQLAPDQSSSTALEPSWYVIGSPDGRRYGVRVVLNGAPTGVLASLRDSNGAAISERLAQALQVFVDSPEAAAGVALPPMSGSHELDGQQLSFTPQFTLTPGVTYRAELHLGPTSTQRKFTVPARAPQPPTSVSGIFPTADALPENNLKFYLQFSAPMRGGDVYEHIHLLDENGHKVEGAFLELPQELWNPEMTRFTVFIFPGRIKRSLGPNEELGPPLTMGKTQTLVIDRSWTDSNGQPLKQEVRKTFRVVEADRQPIDPGRWQISPPRAGGRAAITVDFGESLDQALAQRMIRVVGPGGQPVEGDIVLTDNERKWSLAPDVAWAAGSYQLLVEPAIEDLAGNNIGKAFDVDVFENVSRLTTIEPVSLPFAVR